MAQQERVYLPASNVRLVLCKELGTEMGRHNSGIGGVIKMAKGIEGCGREVFINSFVEAASESRDYKFGNWDQEFTKLILLRMVDFASFYSKKG